MPASGQHICGNKASIFTPVMPGGGAADEEQASIQEAMSAEVDKRMNNALNDLKVKYEGGGSNEETSVHGPNGAAYQQKQRAIDDAQKAERVAAARAEAERGEAVRRQDAQARLDDEGFDSDEEYMDGLQDADTVLRELREKRLAQMKQAQAEKLENLGKGHGRYHEICQDDFLNDVLKSRHTLVHFYHRDFENCKVMHHHLEKLAPRHVECKMMKLDADKAPFFVQKLQVQVMPTVVIFKDGVATARLVGFDGLTDGLPPGKENEFRTDALESWLARAGCVEYEATATEAEIEKFTLAGARAAQMRGYADGALDIEADGELDDILRDDE